jgi:ADP-ribosylglycohydrolase
MDALERKAVGALAGAAVGDALGGATEGWSPARIRERHNGPVTGIVGPFLPDWREARPASPYHKGDGHVTDDTLMTNLLVRVYADKRDHLDAYDVAERLVPLINGEVVWIPELERETVPLIRLFLAEKWLVTRLMYGHVDPREAGVGNVVNCGAAMYSAPIGVANAADPAGAYAEAIEVAGAHQSSYGREAAGVFAAVVAAAFAPGATVSGLVDTALGLAHDGTRAAVEAVCERAAKLATAGVACDDAAEPLREAMAPFDTVGPEYRDPGLGARRPSRLHSIEELPLALGMLVLADGDYRAAVLGGVNYGRDSDSIATMAGAIAGALHGVDGVPAEWREAVGTASRLDLAAGGLTMASVAREIHAADTRRRAAAVEAFATVAGAA